MLTRICKVCGAEKTLNLLVKNKEAKYDRLKLCLKCKAKNNAEYRTGNTYAILITSDKFKASRYKSFTKYEASAKGKIARAKANAKYEAKNKLFLANGFY